MTLQEIMKGMTMVAEGVRTSISAHQLAKKMGVDMPIINQVYEILYEEKDPMDAVKELMTRELKQELEA
jgi:glycerol-3-phosphate dehydrogenase (NAD(P)+)